jgi:ABC-type uncharacterized transport system fused permease/ATPase subunit
VWSFVGVIVVAAPLFALNDYADARLAVEWRAWLAGRLVAEYFEDAAFFRLKLDPEGLDNPDQASGVCGWLGGGEGGGWGGAAAA